MRGTVIGVVQSRGMCIVDCGEGDHSLLEILGGDVEIGDVLRGALDSLGGETVRNITQGVELDVSVENHSMTRRSALRALRRFAGARR